jgi:hypothetical protein
MRDRSNVGCNTIRTAGTECHRGHSGMGASKGNADFKWGLLVFCTDVVKSLPPFQTPLIGLTAWIHKSVIEKFTAE